MHERLDSLDLKLSASWGGYLTLPDFINMPRGFYSDEEEKVAQYNGYSLCGSKNWAPTVGRWYYSKTAEDRLSINMFNNNSVPGYVKWVKYFPAMLIPWDNESHAFQMVWKFKIPIPAYGGDWTWLTQGLLFAYNSSNFQGGISHNMWYHTQRFSCSWTAGGSSGYGLEGFAYQAPFTFGNQIGATYANKEAAVPNPMSVLSVITGTYKRVSESTIRMSFNVEINGYGNAEVFNIPVPIQYGSNYSHYIVPYITFIQKTATVGQSRLDIDFVELKF